MSFKTTQTGVRNPEKQIRFAIAAALTKGAKLVQAADKKAIRNAFTIRTNWDEVGPYAVKVQAAKKTDDPITALVGTGADFIEKFIREPEGQTVIKLPQGHFIAIPTTNVRRTKRDIIRAAQRPARLRGKRDIVLPMRKGGGMVLLQEQGRGRNAKRVVLYLLVPRAKIKERDVLFGPAKKTLDAQLLGLYQREVTNAIATAK
jgi:hypothetical protein